MPKILPPKAEQMQRDSVLGMQKEQQFATWDRISRDRIRQTKSATSHQRNLSLQETTSQMTLFLFNICNNK